MAKKFFYNRVYNTKRMIINIVIIGVCIIGIIICFILTSNFQGENNSVPTSEVSIKSESSIEVNQKFTNEIFFSKIENVNIDDIRIIYPNEFDISKPGKYNVIIVINGKNYDSTLNVVDTIKPELTLKNVTINEQDVYSAKDFVESCNDNSKKDCTIDFYRKGIDEDGNIIDYSSYKQAGTYSIKIIATDEVGNETILETKLIINKTNASATPQPPSTPTVKCKYGNNEYDTDNYLIAVDITTNNCAISLDLYKDTTIASNINKLMESETTRIKKDVSALNLNGTLALNRKVTAIINTSGSGIVGYELQMTVTVSNNGNSEFIAEYKVNKEGKRVFTKNPYNLSN